ncbi:hypothetical protein CRENBAI_013390 [Crenichthys baileyi]|uniref:Uncharacterized protein n=1 Tax=Crenichthys baileyi TaxID=28760 RepID=A0AAV9QTZ9_9TELE
MMEAESSISSGVMDGSYCPILAPWLLCFFFQAALKPAAEDWLSLRVCSYIFIFFYECVYYVTSSLLCLMRLQHFAGLCSQRSLQTEAHVNHLCEFKALLYMQLLLPKASVTSPAEPQCHVFISDSHALIV